ncbi:hypothetical protein HF888_12250 [Bermanella marisrubri]|uniref:Deacetylase sirtuin-type domain-containing protein n=1 Tax=Bermanella marisrubri TaxID=207949 RepID=Q1N324_9GAMM|nr:hypothetical protein [Bermanella marisrubri]EAT12495.1 hypothetical protein RED65_06358 [Oceanobacter sp. RED65] [Bermanella marisrubri]QIZ84943.1 hypothetical protein HF888_12250 [Bermanella marisrubri]
MKLILLGAGASYGSGPTEPYAPPLGNTLFNELEKRGGIAATMPSEIKDLFRENFEQGMAAYTEFTNDNTIGFQRELAHYLASFTPLPGNTYIDLIKEFGIKNTVYVSLNYDLLFELSASLENINTCYSTEKPDNYVSLLKIHGSCNFWPQIPVGQMDGVTIENCNVAIEAPVSSLNQRETLYRCEKEKGLAPAIALYAEGKSVKVSPSYVNRQLAEWKVSASKATKIAIIGVKVHEVDDHVWDIIGKSKAKVWYVGFSSDKSSFDVWKSNHKKKNAFFIESDFSKCIDILKKRFK